MSDRKTQAPADPPADSPATPDDGMHPVDPGAEAQKEGAEDQEESSYS